MRASGARTDARTALRKAAQPGHAPTIYAAVGIAVGYALLEHIGHFGRRFAEFCEDGQRAVDDGCAEYEARDEEWVMRDAA